MLSHSYSDGQEMRRMMKMITIYSTVVRHYAEFGSANSPLVFYFFFSKDLDSNTILQIGHVSKCPFRSLVHKLAQLLLHHHTVEKTSESSSKTT